MFSDEYTQSDFVDELSRFVNGRLFSIIEKQLMADYTDALASIPADDVTALVSQKRKIEALNDLIMSMRSISNQQSLKELNNDR